MKSILKNIRNEPNALRRFRNETPNPTYKAFLQKHLDAWRALEKGQFRRYCMIAVWFLQELMKKPHYNR